MDYKKEIEIVSVRKIEGTGNLKAFVDVRVFGFLVITQCAVMEGRRGLFAVLPRQLARDGKWRDVVICADDEIKSAWCDAILKAYEQELEEAAK